MNREKVVAIDDCTCKNPQPHKRFLVRRKKDGGISPVPIYSKICACNQLEQACAQKIITREDADALIAQINSFTEEELPKYDTLSEGELAAIFSNAYMSDEEERETQLKNAEFAGIHPSILERIKKKFASCPYEEERINEKLKEDAAALRKIPYPPLQKMVINGELQKGAITPGYAKKLLKMIVQEPYGPPGGGDGYLM